LDVALDAQTLRPQPTPPRRRRRCAFVSSDKRQRLPASSTSRGEIAPEIDVVVGELGERVREVQRLPFGAGRERCSPTVRRDLLLECRERCGLISLALANAGEDIETLCSPTQRRDVERVALVIGPAVIALDLLRHALEDVELAHLA